MKQSNYIKILLVSSSMLISGNMNALWGSRPAKSTEEIIQESFGTYKTVHKAYQPILQAYDLTQEVTVHERDHYLKHFIDSVAYQVKADQLPLYGNFLNKMWRSATSYDADYPLKRFESTLVVDSIGHVKKAYQKMLDRGAQSPEIEVFIHKLENIKALVKSSVYYTLEELKIENNNSHTRIRQLEDQLRNERELRMQAEAKVQKPKLYCICQNQY